MGGYSVPCDTMWKAIKLELATALRLLGDVRSNVALLVGNLFVNRSIATRASVGGWQVITLWG